MWRLESKGGGDGGPHKEKEKEKRPMLNIGVVMSCAAELKLLITAMLIVFTLFTLLQFLPSRLSPSDLRSCLSQLVSTSSASSLSPPPPNATSTHHPAATSTNTTAPAPVAAASLLTNIPNATAAEQQEQRPPAGDRVDDRGVVVRAFNPYGTAAYNFITMGAYRGGPRTFAVIGLSSKPLHVFAKPTYLCQWEPFGTGSSSSYAAGYKILPDWGYGRVYTVVVVNCTFGSPVNGDNAGGRLLLHASTAGGGDRERNLTDAFEVLREEAGGVDMGQYSPAARPKYEYLYCGSSLYGGLSPQRVREWVAYHVRLMGPRSHFVLHDAGGIHPEVIEVLRPWMELGYVTLQDIRAQERFDGYYHNQFLVVNDCLHRYRFQARWMFFFDVDEYLYVPPKNTLASVLASLAPFSQFTIQQMPMSGKLCLSADYGRYYRKWGIEKLVYRDVKRGIRRDRKYAIQPRNVFATGVHMSQNLAGKTNHKTETMIKYFHYHGTIAQRREPCRNLLNATQVDFDNNPYVLDTTMRDIAWSVKKFELRMIGPRLRDTRQ